MRSLRMYPTLFMALTFVMGAASELVEPDIESTVQELLSNGWESTSTELAYRFLQEGATPSVFHRDLVLKVAQALLEEDALDDAPVISISLPLKGFVPNLAALSSVTDDVSTLVFQVKDCVVTKNGKGNKKETIRQDKFETRSVPKGLVDQWPKFLDEFAMSCSGEALVDLSAFGVGTQSGPASFICAEGNEQCLAFFSVTSTCTSNCETPEGPPLTRRKLHETQMSPKHRLQEMTQNRTLQATLPTPLVSYIPSWAPCPSDEQISKHTHLIYAFAHSCTSGTFDTALECYTQCNIGCTLTFDFPSIGNPASCNCSHIRRWQEAGKKVLLSFGGDGQGRLYTKSGCPSCWDTLIDTCGSSSSVEAGKQVASRLVDLVKRYGFDGVDINYEYIADAMDISTLASPKNVPYYMDFLESLTIELKQQLPADQNIVTHAPMAGKVIKDSPYFMSLGNLVDTNRLDFVFPQYYNTLPALSPGSTEGQNGLKAHYQALAARLTKPKVLVGLCPDVIERNNNPAYNVLGCIKTDDVNGMEAKALVDFVEAAGVMVWASDASEAVVAVMQTWSNAIYPTNNVAATPGTAKSCFVACSDNESCTDTNYFNCDTTTKICYCQSRNGYMCAPDTCRDGKHTCAVTSAPVAPTPPPTPYPAPPPPTCFSGHSTVNVLNKGPVAMKELQIGDVIVKRSNHRTMGSQVYEPVYAFGHVNHTSMNDFLQVTALDSEMGGSLTRLEISPDHLVFLFGQPDAVPARAIQAGDWLQGEYPHQRFQVLQVKVVHRQDGAFAPFTPSGRLVVNGIQVSAYVSLRDMDNSVVGASMIYGVALGIVSEQSLSHFFTSPLRVWCMTKLPFFSSKECHHSSYYTQEGILKFAKMGKDFFNKLEELNPVLQIVLLVVSILLVAPLYVAEIFVGPEYVLFALIAFFSAAVMGASVGFRFTVVGPLKSKAE